jgi:hypothetical protein
LPVLDNLKYAKSHEARFRCAAARPQTAADAPPALAAQWVKVEGDIGTIGITDHAQARCSGACASPRGARQRPRCRLAAFPQQPRWLRRGSWRLTFAPQAPALRALRRHAPPPLTLLPRRASWATWCTWSCRRWAPR